MEGTISRRALLKLGLVLGAFGGRLAAAAATEDLSESDSAAVALGYKSDVKKVDVTKFPKAKFAVKKNEVCKTCTFFKNPKDGKGECLLFPRKLVAEQGWCNSWSRRT